MSPVLYQGGLLGQWHRIGLWGWGAAIRGSSEKSKEIDTCIAPKRRKSQSLNKVPLSIELGNTLHTYRVIF